MKEKLKAQFKGLDPVQLFQEIRLAQQTLGDLVSHDMREAAPAKSPDVDVFPKSLCRA